MCSRSGARRRGRADTVVEMCYALPVGLVPACVTLGNSARRLVNASHKMGDSGRRNACVAIYHELSAE